MNKGLLALAMSAAMTTPASVATAAAERADELTSIALKLDANHRSAHEYLGELYLDINQPENAEKQLAALKKACPFFGSCEEYDDLKKAIDAYKVKKK